MSSKAAVYMTTGTRLRSADIKPTVHGVKLHILVSALWHSLFLQMNLLQPINAGWG
jgi:hypothetical protein